MSADSTINASKSTNLIFITAGRLRSPQEEIVWNAKIKLSPLNHTVWMPRHDGTLLSKSQISFQLESKITVDRWKNCLIYLPCASDS